MLLHEIINTSEKVHENLLTLNFTKSLLPPANEVWGKVIQGGHTVVKMKFPVFSLSFPCVT